MICLMLLFGQSNPASAKMGDAFGEMPADSPAAKAAHYAGWTIPLNYQPVHECLKELQAGPYENYGKVTLGDVIGKYLYWLVVIVATMAAMVTATVYFVRLNRKFQNSITERKQIEETLRNSESKFRTLYETTSDAVMLLDEKGFFDCNDATLNIFGCDNREQFLAHHPSELSPAVGAPGERRRRQLRISHADRFSQGSGVRRQR